MDTTSCTFNNLAMARRQGHRQALGPSLPIHDPLSNGHLSIHGLLDNRGLLDNHLGRLEKSARLSQWWLSKTGSHLQGGVLGCRDEHDALVDESRRPVVGSE